MCPNIYSNKYNVGKTILNHPFMVMTGGWFIIVLPTLLLLIITDISDPQACYRTRSEMKETTSRDRYHARRKKTYLRICGDRISLRYCWVYHITQSHRSGLLWSMLAWVNLPSIYIPNYIYIYIYIRRIPDK